MNMCELLLTHRNETTMASKLGSVGGPGTKARHGEPSVGELPEQPVQNAAHGTPGSGVSHLFQRATTVFSATHGCQDAAHHAWSAHTTAFSGTHRFVESLDDSAVAA